MIDATQTDPCSGPFCLRDVARDGSTGDYRFTLDIRTSVGVVKIKGWRWLRAHNRIVAPSCHSHHIVVVPTHVRAIIRKLLTKIVKETRGFDIPPIKRIR